MRVCLVVYELLPFGGLEEFAATLAVALRSRGQAVSLVSMTWVPPDNQYRQMLNERGVAFVQYPPWVHRLAPDWVARERIVARLVRLLGPLAALLAVAVWAFKRRPWPGAVESAQGWLTGQLWRLVGPDRREALGRVLLRWWAWRWRPDLLHIHGYTSFLPYVIEWASARGLPAVYQEHQTPVAEYQSWWDGFRRSINKAQVVVAASEQSAQALREFCGVSRPIAAMFPVVADPYSAGWQPDGVGPGPCHPLRVTTIARLELNKGLGHLLEAVAQVRRSHPATQFRVYGEGSLRAELLAHAVQLGLEGEAIFAGAFRRSDLPRIMAETDIFVLASIMEGLPLALLEAMSYGRTILVTSVGGNSDVIQHGVSGLLCPPADPDCLARNLIALLDDAALRARLGQAARAAYETGRFHPDAVCERFLSLYRQAIAESPSLNG